MIFSPKLTIIFLQGRKKGVPLHREMERFLSKYKVVTVAALLTLFGAAFAVESLGNHLLFRTYGLDLGIYTQTAWDFTHLRVNDGTFYHWQAFNQLGDHFDLLLALLSPLTWLVPAAWLLLVVQILAVLSGAWGLYRLTRHLTGAELPSLLAMLLMLCQFGVWHAIGFDYHSNVVAACQLPWLILLVRKHRLGAATALLLFMIISKETVALWLCLVLAALMFDHRHDRPAMRWLVAAAIGCATYFAVVSMLVMPSLGGGTGSGFWRYEWMGATMGEVARWIVTHPLEALRDFFVDFTPDADRGALKTEFFICALASGMLLTFLKPNYLIMLVPPLVMKMLSAYGEGFWGIAKHYNIEICVVCCCATALVVSRIRRNTWRNATATVALALALCTTLYTISHPLTPINRDNVNIFKSSHWHQNEFNTGTARQALGMIPADASVCATTMFTPHLATRDSAYIFPMGLAYNAEYYLLLRHSWTYYENEEDMVATIIADTATYRTLFTDGDIYLLQRK